MSKNANFSRISTCQSVYISVILLQFLLQGYWYGLKTIQTDKNLDRYIDRLSADSRPIYRTAIFWLLTKCRPITDRYIGQVSTNYRRSVGEKSAKCRWTKSYIGRDTSGTTIDRVSTECRPTIDRYIDRLSTEYWPSVDRPSTECRPTIDRGSTATSTDISVDITHSKQDPKG